MVILTNTNRRFVIELRLWLNGNWGPDVFDDLETGFAAEHERVAGDVAFAADEDEVERMLYWWQVEVKAANNNDDYIGDGLSGRNNDACMGVDGEWVLKVEEVAV